MLSAFYQVITGRAPNLLRAYLLAVLIQMPFVNLLAQFDLVQVPIAPFYGLATVAAGLLFGLGMVLAVGCAGAVFYRAGEGKLDYVFSISTYALAAWATNEWLAKPIRDLFGSVNPRLTLHTAFTVDRWLVVAMVVIGVVLWLLRGRQHIGTDRWDWWRTGIALGIVGVGAWVTSTLTGQPSGLGTMAGSIHLAALVVERDFSAFNWNLFFVAGIPMGSFIASSQHGKSPGKPFRSERIPQALAGGLMMGLGASIAGGDSILHGLSGVPVLAVSSFVFIVTAFLGSWLGIRLGWLD